MPFISVIITAHNRKEFLLEAVNSALNQTLPKDEYEIIVVKNFQDFDDILTNLGISPSFREDLGYTIKRSLKYCTKYLEETGITEKTNT